MKKYLSYENIDSKPRHQDFTIGYGDIWHIPLPLTPQEDSDETYVPIYNYIYQLGEYFTVPKDFRRRLVNTTIVRVDDAHYLALTGAGMDMSWEICESYLNLGYYPPVHFSRLPEMAGRGTSAKDKRIVRGCLKSLDAMVARYQRDREWMKETYSPEKMVSKEPTERQ